MIMDTIVYKLPKDVGLSLHIREKAKAYFEIYFQGQKYYVPITKEMMIIFNLRILKKKIEFPDAYKTRSCMTEMLRDIIDSIHLQVRDGVCAGIEDSLHQQLKDGFSDLFAGVIHQKVRAEILTRITSSIEVDSGTPKT